MIKKRNLDNSLIQWIMTVTGLGPGIGDIKYLTPAAASTSQYRTQLQSMDTDDDDIYTTLLAAETALTAYRNDIVLVFPGLFTNTAVHDWDKAHTHLMGLGGPNTRGHYRTSSASDMRNVNLHTVTTDQADVINVTGENCQFLNVHIHNEGSHANNVSALRVNSYGFYGRNLAIRGATGTDALSAVEAGSLYVHTDADYATFENCTIGHNTYSGGNKSGAKSGHLVFSSGATSGPQNTFFKGCYFQLKAEATNVGLVRFSGGGCVDRDHVFEDCLFTNFWTNNADRGASVFYNTVAGVQAANVVLRRCTARGFDEWQITDLPSAGAAAFLIEADMPVVDCGGGLTRLPSTGPFTSVIRDYTSS